MRVILAFPYQKALQAQRDEFKGFRENAGHYYITLLGFALFDTFKADMTDAGFPETVYATTFRRRFLDVAGKVGQPRRSD